MLCDIGKPIAKLRLVAGGVPLLAGNGRRSDLLGRLSESLVRRAHGVRHERPAVLTATFPASETNAVWNIPSGTDEDIYTLGSATWTRAAGRCSDGHPVPVMIAIHPMVQNGEVTGAVISPR